MTLQQIRRTALTGVALALTLAAATDAAAQERVRWKMQSAFTSTLAHLGT